MNSTDVKPGYTTTEFWVHLLVELLAAATAILAIVTPGFHLSSAIQGLVPAIAALLALGSQLIYTVSRHKLKTQAADNTVVVAKINASVTPAPPAAQSSGVLNASGGVSSVGGTGTGPSTGI